jgi:hypothetical protein
VSKERDNQARQASEKLLLLAQQQGVKPFDFDAFLSAPPPGPDDETVDEMIDAIYRWRLDEDLDRDLSLSPQPHSRTAFPL